jgi:hypothetical protein
VFVALVSESNEDCAIRVLKYMGLTLQTGLFGYVTGWSRTKKSGATKRTIGKFHTRLIRMHSNVKNQINH